MGTLRKGSVSLTVPFGGKSCIEADKELRQNIF
jgi:hypothetical protein